MKLLKLNFQHIKPVKGIESDVAWCTLSSAEPILAEASLAARCQLNFARNVFRACRSFVHQLFVKQVFMLLDALNIVHLSGP